MSALTAIHFPVHRATPRKHGAVRERLTSVLRRLADSPLDIRAAPGPAAARTPSARAQSSTAPHAHWHPVTGPDGRRHLEATWH
ncbi:hypothetical protein C9F11_45745 (plasmid) [Streptomyces sp. YIM 121038]|uniref:hypothetical protein n=1 Tax=Streptomyces sp. YIM 121038 TaxID=2136401 RepID=UPI001110C6D8|nr:hypothetical protein [Streptomyces sp. YIM 121038]QCX82705.1 hypothetical protein C9F11_45745 [Streptomyces sp. YIM 121038]